MKKVSGYIFITLFIQVILFSSCKEKENESPTVKITTPADGTFVMRGDQLSIKAEAEDSDGQVETLKFYLKYVEVSALNKKPYEYLWTVPDTVIGAFEIRAVAIDNDGGATSSTITVTVDAPGGFNPDLTYGTVSDFDGNTYRTIQIGNQNWMAENLKVIHYADGSPVPLVSDQTQWTNLGESDRAYCWYDNMSEYADTTGGLYSWPGAMNGASGFGDSTEVVQGVCPDGWHLPSDGEWKELEMFLGMSQEVADKYEWRGTYEGGKLKELGFSHWNIPNLSGDNSSGFTSLPGGYRSYTGTFYGLGQYSAFWSSSQKAESTTIWFRALNFNKTNIYRYWVPGNRGASVRCVQDN